MANQIKYSTGSEILALKKGNFYIGTGDIGKGPTSSTGYYSGIEPPSGGYTVYLNKASGGPSIYTCTNDTQLISLTNKIAGQSYTTANECLSYFAGQTDKIVLNRTYEPIVTNGLVLNLDAGFTPSYPKNGTTWYDLSTSTNNGTLTNGPTFNSSNGGSVVFDGSDDYVNCGNNNSLKITGPLTINTFFKASSFNIEYQPMVAMGDDSYRFQRHASTNYLAFGSRNIGLTDLVSNSQITTNQWYNATAVYTGTQMLIYINGILDSAGSASGSLPVSNYNLWVGGNAQITSRIWNGNIAIAQIYNRALSPTEVLQNFNAQKGRFGL